MEPEIEKSRQRLLDSSQPLDVEIRCSALQLLANMRDRLALRADADTESLTEIVHQTRVDSKRLRALWRLLKPGLKTVDYRRLERLSKGLAKPLASSRDAQVMQETLDWVSADLAPDVRQRLLPGLAQVLEQGMAADEPALLQVVQSLLRLEQAVVTAELGSIRKRHLHKGLKQTCRKGSNIAHEALQKHAMEPMHRWRKWVKLLLFQSGWLLDEAAPKWTPRLKTLGSALGRLHDLDVLAEQMQSARACFWQQDLDQVNTGIEAARQKALAEIDALAEGVYAKGASKRAKQLYRRWQH
ncbi:CHAD domain-containing protein [Marinobacterium sp. MBR-109]|jgi:CHAD domain-containing protein|uniref:CHAD domain-containing protein n=1 Tax=Marinobacterium sp. MBR-109 TaxID=3156462 RepID=UPI00339B3C45